MYLVVDVGWAKKHPREAARIQIVYLMCRVRRDKRARLKTAGRLEGAK